jgi:hypothetical protein
MEKSSLWKNTLGPQSDDFEPHRSRYRQSLISFREKIGQLISTIPSDMKGYTVHDLSHLDALWQMADIVAGERYELNPAEAFVFGGAILLHDSGMTVSAYSGGIEEVKKSVEYADAFSQLTAKRPEIPGIEPANKSHLEEQALTDALRVNHAAKAEQLATQKWESPLDGSSVFLLDDSELREHFGRCIGRIAHSHHWDINDIPRKFNASLGAFSGSPSSWSINQIKIALLLRCVDAMHIDDRRAPKLLSSTWRPVGTSIDHWKFQNKLTQPQVVEKKILYTSKSPFGIEESISWHLCFDVISMIDKELRSAEELQNQAKIPSFLANGVAGATSAESLSKYIEVDGWKPLPLNLQVSNVSSLAKTLGGKDLYNYPLAPLRELIQNAADAIEARVFIDPAFSIEDGQITIRIIESRESISIDVEDNGIGMSERTLTNALLDFGYSFWRSTEARSEFPGLQKSSSKFRGRYGIGFFSVFMWSDKVVVSSRRFSDGLDMAKSLDFRSGLDARPILRASTDAERSTKWSTRVSLHLRQNAIRNPPQHDNYRYYRPFGILYQEDWQKRLKLLCGALGIKVVLERAGSKAPVSLPSWRSCPPNELFDFFADILLTKDETNFRFVSNITNLSENMPTSGRCFISPYDRGKNLLVIYDKGIFVNIDHSDHISGIVETETTNAARDRFSSLSVKNDEKWITEVRSKTFSACHNIGEILTIQKVFLDLGYPDINQPMFIKARKIVSHSEIIREIDQTGRFNIILSEIEQDQFGSVVYESISPITGLEVDDHRIYVLVALPGSIGLTDDVVVAIRTKSDPLFKVLRDFINALGPEPEIKHTRYEAEGYRKDYIHIKFRRTS